MGSMEETFVVRLERALAARRPSPVDPAGARPAAVLIPIVATPTP